MHKDVIKWGEGTCEQGIRHIFAHVPIGLIRDCKYNPKNRVVNIVSSLLFSSFRDYGQCQGIILKEDKEKDGYYVLVDGHRRFYAAKELGNEYVYVDINMTTPEDALYVAINSTPVKFSGNHWIRTWLMCHEAVSKQMQTAFKNIRSIVGADIFDYVALKTDHGCYRTLQFVKQILKFTSPVTGEVRPDSPPMWTATLFALWGKETIKNRDGGFKYDKPEHLVDRMKNFEKDLKKKEKEKEKENKAA